MRENTYYARVFVRADDRTIELDARPSDAIALALRTRAPIHVAKQVLVQSSYVQECESTGDQNLSNVSPDQWADILEKMAPDDFKYKM